VLTDMIDRAFNDIFTQSYANTDAYISGKSPDFSFNGDQVAAPSIPASVLPAVKKLPDVQAAAGTVADDSATKIIDRKGKPITTSGAPTFGFGLDYSLPQFNPLKLTAGSWPRKPDEVVIDSGTAGDQNYKVGDTVKVATLKPVRPFTLVGIAQYGTVGSIGSATFATFTLPAAQELLDRKGQLDAVSVSAKSGISQDQLVGQIKQVVPLNKVEVRTRAEQVKEAKKSASFTKIIKYFCSRSRRSRSSSGRRDLQHAVDHGLSADPRVRDAADDRSVAPPASDLGQHRSLRHRAPRSDPRAVRGIGLAVGLNALFKASNNDLPTTA
jgi:putative ABC transport system permease protein